ncbi:Protein of unknown function [Hydrobacter penzbergensis]|uniref:DUF3570 domain-containing protein n=1 Tax=Hydrobacter penzbergensis TaxID=1235997 RepID=A0A8X8L9Y5_9BACT|nr:DUF3570 domain-containing protein [Hydrobacter penzbergensis]SDW16280.1 Protein of unknown function [Hydrobacter penzbergensis]
MKKICLFTIGLYLNILAAFAQKGTADTSAYRDRKLHLDEVNLVTSYYQQNGNNSAVTGGIGTEHLTDFANSFDIKLSRYDKKLRKHSFEFDLGLDTYSSASSDKIDPRTISSASSSDMRIYPSLSWSVENLNKGTTVGANISSSTEYDYQSFGFGISAAKKSKDNNREVSVRLQTYLDNVTLISPIELRTAAGRGDNYGSSPRNTYNAAFGLSQVVNKRLQMSLLVEAAYQKGYLGLPFHRVYFTDNSLRTENLPTTRFKIPIGLRANYFIGDNLVFRSFYRFYKDDWGIMAHTADLETAYKINPFISVSPFYRFYTQTAANYFAPYKVHGLQELFYTSNYDLSNFNSQFFGAGLRLTPANGILGIHKLAMLEIRAGHYRRNNGLSANIVSLNLKFK